MEFWSAEVKPSKKYSCSVENGEFVHISNAALASATDKAVLKLRVAQNGEEKEIVICTLIPEKSDQISLDLVLDRSFTLTQTSSGSVHLTGYKTEPDTLEEDSEYDEDFLEEPVAPLPSDVKVRASSKSPKENGKPLVKDLVKKAIELPKIASKPGFDISDDDDDSEEDDSDDEDDDEQDAFDFEGTEDDDDDDDGEEEEFDDDDDDDDDSDSEDDEDDVAALPTSAMNKKRSAEALAITPPSEKKIKTPSGKVAVKSESKAEVKPKTPKTPKTPKDEKKSEKKAKKEKDTSKATPSTDVKSKGTPGTDAKSGSKLAGKFTCEPCARVFTNESAITQHNAAKHKK